MEDPESEWEIQEYPPSKSKDGTTTVRWILNKGYGIGKIVVITGIAISSAPLVLPPLIVFSAIGVAFAVPFGLVFASYACTNTIMSKLLPTPSSSFMEEYHEDEEEEEEEREEDESRRENMMQEEEKEQIEDMKREVEMRLTLNDGGSDNYRQKEEDSITNFDESVDVRGYCWIIPPLIQLFWQLSYPSVLPCYAIYYTDEDEDDDNQGTDEEFKRENETQQEEKEQMEKTIEQGVEADEDSDEYKQQEGQISIMNDNVDENGCEEDVGEFIKGDDDITEERNEEEPSTEMHRVVSFVAENEEINGNTGKEEKVIEPEEEEIAQGSTGLLEKMRDEGKVNNIAKDDSLGVFEPHDVSNDDDIKIKDESKPYNSGIKNDEEKGYEKDVGEFIEGDDDITEERNKEEPSTEMQRVVSLVAENEEINENMGKEEKVIEPEEEEIAQGSTGLLEKMRDEGQINNIVKDDSLSVYEAHDVSNDDDIKIKVDSKPYNSGIKNDEEHMGNVNEPKGEEIVRGNTGLMEEISDDREINDVEDDFLGVNDPNRVSNGEDVNMTKLNIVKEVDSEKLVNSGSKNDEEPVGEMHRVVVLDGGNEENNFNSREVEELDLVARGVERESQNKEKEMKSESDEQIMKESMGLMEKVEDSTADDEHDSDVERKKQRLIDSNADVREIADESGLDLFDDKNAADYQSSNMNFESVEGNNEVKEYNCDDSVDVLALPGFRRVILASNNAEVDSKTDKKVPSREAFTKEKKIWEQIGAMRAIVGYKAASQTTCIGEVKALYVFTGVEPPASFKDDSNLDEVYDMLKFLMAIVGVK